MAEQLLRAQRAGQSDHARAVVQVPLMQLANSREMSAQRLDQQKCLARGEPAR